MLASYKRLLTNVGLLLLCLSTTMSAAAGATESSFGLKYFTVVFQLPPSVASLVTIALFPSFIIGNLVGGYLIKRRKWSPAKCALLILFGDAVAIVFIPVYLTLGCSTQNLAGISTDYTPPAPYDTLPAINDQVTLPGSAQLARSPCNANCSCGNEAYNPVCGADGIMYVSPCYAGCEAVKKTEDENSMEVQSFVDCRCINSIDGNATAVDGECSASCQAWQLPVLISAAVVQFMCGALGRSGMVLIALRIVEDDLRASALGLQQLVQTLLGSLPAPIYVGALINSACILWGYQDGQKGACWVYDLTTYRLSFYGLMGAYKVVSTLLFTGVFFVLRDSKKKEDDNLSGDKAKEVTEKHTI